MYCIDDDDASHFSIWIEHWTTQKQDEKSILTAENWLQKIAEIQRLKKITNIRQLFEI